MVADEDRSPMMSHPTLSQIAQSMRNSSSEYTAKSSFPMVEQGKNRISFLKQHRFVGRKGELKQLNECFHRVKTEQTSELVLIHGPPGVGKSSLVRNFAGSLPATTLRVEGKFEKRRTHVLYAAFVAASDQLCRQISRQDNCNDIRERIRSLLGPEINLLGNLVPKLSEIIYQEETNDQSTVDTATGTNAFTRFKLLFRAFLRCVACPQNPLVFFLDDLQWADTASLEVLSSIVTDGMSQNMLLICAYREDELPTEIIEKYIFSDRRKQIKSIPNESSSCFYSGKISTISIPMLDSPTLNKVISAILSLEEKDTESLSSLVVAKTDGNPFYALSFLDMLYTSGLLRKENDDFWIWDENYILRQTNVADNLASILEAKLLQYPDEVLSILQIASFIGNDFSAFILATIVFEEQDMIVSEYSFDRNSRDTVQQRIQDALKFAVDDGILETAPDSNSFKFAHDKIQHVLYEDFMPDETERQLLHYRIGKILKNSLFPSVENELCEQRIFLAANNMNRALKVLDYNLERYDVIELNLTAAKCAIKKAAFLTAVDYLRIALKLLDGDSSWERHYDLCMDLHSTAAEVENIVGCHEKCTELISQIQKRAKSLQHAAAAYEIQMNSLANQYYIKGAVILGLDVLRKIGVKIPRKITVFSVIKEFIRAKMALGRRSLDDLLYLPEITDQWALTSLRLMTCVVMKAFLLGDHFKEVFAVICLRMFRITIRYGVSGIHAPIAFLAWGSIHAVFGKFDVGIHSEQLAFRTIDKMKAEAIRGQTTIMSYSVTHLWRYTLDHGCRQDLLNAYHQAMSYGDIFRAQFGMVGWVLLGTYLDSSLIEIHNRMRSVVAEMHEYDAKCSLIFLLPKWQSLLNLTGDARNSNKSLLRGEALDDDFVNELHVIDSKLSLFGLNQNEMMIAYAFEDWNKVAQTLPIFRKYEHDSIGYYAVGCSYTWAAICHYELYRLHKRRKHRVEGRRAHAKVRQWATTGTVMLEVPHQFLNAMEYLSSMDKKRKTDTELDEVETRFRNVMTIASNARYHYFEALANEVLGKFFLQNETSSEQNKKAVMYLTQAIDLYNEWGAHAKGNFLSEKLQELT